MNKQKLILVKNMQQVLRRGKFITTHFHLVVVQFHAHPDTHTPTPDELGSALPITWEQL